MKLAFTALAILSAGIGSPVFAEFDQTHALYNDLLKKNVKNGLVNYSAIKRDASGLNNYLSLTASVTEPEFKQWTREQQIAFLANLYNAQTIRLIADHYPVKSIKDIGGLIKGPWKQPVVQLFGRKITLDELEHGVLRKNYGEPRLHFVLVCAAMGCPPIRNEAYIAAKLNAQMEDQGKLFLSQSRKNSVNTAMKIVYLSLIFKWFEADFTGKSGTVLAFVQSYFPTESAREIIKGGFKIVFTDYDWSLNDQPK